MNIRFLNYEKKVKAMKKGCLMAGAMKNRFYNSSDYKVVNKKERAHAGFWVVVDEAFVGEGFV